MTKRKDGRWCEGRRIQYADGTSEYKYFYGKAGESDSKQKADIRRQIARANLDAYKPVTFGKAAETWKNEHDESVTHNAAEFYGTMYKRTVEHFGRRAVAEITAAELDAYIKQIASQGYARRTVQGYRDMLNMIFDRAIVAGWISINPMDGVRMPRGLPSETREPPTDDELARISANFENGDCGLLAAIGCYAGLRRGEILALTWDDIDLDRRLITVNKSVYFDVNAPAVKAPKTDAGNRVVGIPDRLAELLAAVPGVHFPGYYLLGGERPWTKSMLRKRWQAWLKSIGAEGVTPHQLRHYYATLLYHAGVAPKAAQAALGHASITVTQDIYTHIQQREQIQVTAAIDSYLSSSNVKSMSNTAQSQ